jgi:hypothetical protein
MQFENAITDFFLSKDHTPPADATTGRYSGRSWPGPKPGASPIENSLSPLDVISAQGAAHKGQLMQGPMPCSLSLCFHRPLIIEAYAKQIERIGMVDTGPLYRTVEAT